MLLGFDDGLGGDGPGLVNPVRLGYLWQKGGRLCAVVLSGFGWDWVLCRPGLF